MRNLQLLLIIIRYKLASLVLLVYINIRNGFLTIWFFNPRWIFRFFFTLKKPESFRIPAIYKRENKQWKVNLRLRYNRLFLQQLLVLSSEEKVSEYRLHILHEYLLPLLHHLHRSFDSWNLHNVHVWCSFLLCP